jgi:rubrerythrin
MPSECASRSTFFTDFGPELDRYYAKLERQYDRGLERRAFNCRHCGRYRSRPADECPYCGDAEGSYGSDPHEVNRAYGYGS